MPKKSVFRVNRFHDILHPNCNILWRLFTRYNSLPFLSVCLFVLWSFCILSCITSEVVQLQGCLFCPFAFLSFVRLQPSIVARLYGCKAVLLYGSLVCEFVSLLVCLFVCWFVCLFVCWFLRLLVCLFVKLLFC